MPTEGEDSPLDHADEVLATFGDATPKTAETVAEETGLDVETVRATLSALVERDALSHKAVHGNDDAERRLTSEELSDLAIDLWYLPADRVAGGTVVVTMEDEEAVEAALDELSFPGASDLMREWRRDAVRAAYEYLHDRHSTTDADFVEEVYPTQPAGYATGEAWWDCVAPRLAELPDVESDDGEWRVDS